MYNTNNILNKKEETPITMENILARIPEYDIFAKYIGDFKIGYIYKSPLREDNNPSFGIFVSNKTGSLLYKDLASNDCGNVFKFVKTLKKLTTYKETLLEITKDFNIVNYDSIPKLTHTGKHTVKQKETLITVVRKKFNDTDIKFWAEFGISRDVLEIYKVSAISKYLVNGVIKGGYIQDNPLYCYKVFNKFKIYRPLGAKIMKWRGNLTTLDIQGFEQLPAEGELLIITKSLKDVMVLHLMGYNAVAPSSESMPVPEIVMNNLKRRFKKIVIFYDRDRAGMEFARKMSTTFNINAIFINKKYKTKDISDLVKGLGYAKALEIFNEMIN